MPARLEEDSAAGWRGSRRPKNWLRTAAVKNRIAGFRRAARPLIAWLDTNVGSSATEGTAR
jgi:hypothetical protein